MKLSELLAPYQIIPPASDREIHGLAIDSRLVQPGDLFVACAAHALTPAQFTHMSAHIKQAEEKGAVAIIHDNSERFFDCSVSIPKISVPNLRELLSFIAAKFYDFPATKIPVVGVTGTNGKTSSCHFIASLLQQQGKKCGVLGTVGNGLYGELQPSSLTTLDPINLQHWLANFQKEGADCVAMEVSSHGLAQCRVDGIQFKIAGFTNLTRDHLDYHATLDNYAAAKRKLFTLPKLKAAVINYDDEYGQKLIQEFSSKLPVFAYSTQTTLSAENSVFLENLNLNQEGFSATLQSPWGKAAFHSPLFGRHNASNILLAATTALLLDLPFSAVINSIPNIVSVAGRMQKFGGNKQPLIVVDFAHTPDALQKVLHALREHSQGKIWCVFGCGGDRDRGKRPLMGEIAVKFADQIIVTNDNPRHEDPEQITQEIVKDLAQGAPVVVEHDRAKAIRQAIKQAKPGDIVLIAGKGHETYQQIGDEKKPFNDAIEVQSALSE